MGLFNVLKANIKCINCKQNFAGQIQFKFGQTDHLFYEIGDKIKWGGYEIGFSGLAKVKVYGILESEFEQCTSCGYVNSNSEFDIVIKSDIITSVDPLLDIEIYNATDGGTYAICIEYDN